MQSFIIQNLQFSCPSNIDYVFMHNENGLQNLLSARSSCLWFPTDQFPQLVILCTLHQLCCVSFPRTCFQGYVQLKQMYISEYIYMCVCVKMYITSIYNIQDAFGKHYSQGFSFKLFKQQITLLIENLKINLRIVFHVLGITKRFGISRLCQKNMTS